MTHFRKNIKAVWLLTAILLLALAGPAMAEGPKWIGAFFLKGKIGLKWQAFEGASQYKVYRKVGSGEFVEIVTSDKTQYFDTGLTPGENHVYKIAAVDASGTETFSSEKAVMVAGGSAATFMPPVWVGIRTDRRGALLAWDGVKGAIAYNIHRSTVSGGPYEIIGNSATHKYSDYDVEQGTTYYYVLDAMNEEFEETEKSKEQSVKYGLTEEEKLALDTNRIVLEDTKLTFLFAIEEAGNLGTLNLPTDVALNSKGDIYVTDTRRFRVDCFDSEGKHKFSFGERTEKGDKSNPPEGTFESPMPIAVDTQDQVYVGDNQNHDIQVFAPDGKFVKRIRCTVPEAMDAFRPNGLYVLDDGRILATDAGSHSLLYLDMDGNILKQIQHGGTTPEEQDKLWFSFPTGVTVSQAGVISVVDQMGARIQQFNLDGTFVRTFGQSGFVAGQFGRPKGVVNDAKGRLWVSDGMASVIQIFSPEGVVTSAIVGFDDTEHRLASPFGMVIRDGRFYLVTRDAHKVLVFEIGQ